MYRIRLLKLPKLLVLTGKSVTTNIRPLAARKCHCSSEQSNDHVIGAHCHMFSYVFLALTNDTLSLQVLPGDKIPTPTLSRPELYSKVTFST
jgi:hypothetical protein